MNPVHPINRIPARSLSRARLSSAVGWNLEVRVVVVWGLGSGFRV